MGAKLELLNTKTDGRSSTPSAKLCQPGGDRFFVLPGSSVDGNQFLSDVAEVGASAAKVSDPTRATNSPGSLLKRQKLIAFVLVVAAALLAYHNSFTGPFVFNDLESIPENSTIRHLWPIWQCLSPPHRGGITVEGRPLINLSLAINYALGGYKVWGYHALNLTVHILAGLTLLGIVRRTLLQPALRGRFGAAADKLALATAVLWTLHPLQTESVTYIIQRAESVMGLFYLLTLYCFIRGVESPRRRLWYSLSMTACALGMASKEVMVSAPVMVLLYDRAFLSGSFREAWRRRWPLYLGLSVTWVLLGYLLTISLGNALTIAGHLHRTWWEYLATEPQVILYYLRVSVWPSPLCLGYGWPIAKTWMDVLPSAVVVAVLLAASAWAWRKNSVWGFVGAWFFLILVPTSSFIPLLDPMYEHRMYLPLAAVVSVVVMGLYTQVRRLNLTMFLVVAIGLGFLTWQRNHDYRSEVAFWGDAAAKISSNPVAHCNLGVSLARAGRIQEAIGHWEQALWLNPNDVQAHNNLGAALWRTGKAQEARRHWEQALRLDPNHADTRNNLAWLLAALAPEQGGDPVRAVALAHRVCEQTGCSTATYLDTLAVAYAAAGQFNDAVVADQRAIELARSAGRPELVRELEARLQLYREGHPYRMSFNETSPRKSSMRGAGVET